MTERFEYRVRWQRGDHREATRIFQTIGGARNKIHGLLAMDQVKGDTQRWADMPDLEGSPILERRVVGDWEVMDGLTEAPLEVVCRFAEWAGLNDSDRELAPATEDEIPF